MPVYRYRGFPPELEAQAKRLGLPHARAQEAVRIRPLGEMSDLLAQVCEKHSAATRTGDGTVQPYHAIQIRDILSRAAHCRDRLAVAFATSQALLDDACSRTGTEPEPREFDQIGQIPVADKAGGNGDASAPSPHLPRKTNKI